VTVPLPATTPDAVLSQLAHRVFGPVRRHVAELELPVDDEPLGRIVAGRVHRLGQRVTVETRSTIKVHQQNPFSSRSDSPGRPLIPSYPSEGSAGSVPLPKAWAIKSTGGSAARSGAGRVS
jgi:hypothetical protein